MPIRRIREELEVSGGGWGERVSSGGWRTSGGGVEVIAGGEPLNGGVGEGGIAGDVGFEKMADLFDVYGF